MLSTIAKAAIERIEKRIASLNKRLVGEKLFIYKSSNEFCVVVLLNSTTESESASWGFDANSKRDICLTNSFLSLVESTRAREAQAVAA